MRKALGLVLLFAALVVGFSLLKRDKPAPKYVAPKVVEKTLRISVHPSAERLRPTLEVKNQVTPTIYLAAARGESEGVQIALRPKRHQSKLPITIDGLDLSWKLYEEQPVEVKNASPMGATGWYFDPLLPVKDTVVVRADRAVVLWLDVKVPKSAKPGVRSGTMTIGEGKLARTIPISVDVGTVALPDKPLLSTSVGVDETQIIRFEKPGKSHKKIAAARDKYYKLLSDNRLTPADWFTPPSIGQDLPGFAASDFATEFHTAIERRGINRIRVPWYQTYPFKDPFDADRDETLAYLKGVAKYFRSKKLMDDNYVYVIDEPQQSDAAKVHKLAELAHEADPDFKVLLTHEPAKPFLRGNDIDIWATNISHRVRKADIDAAHKRGEEYWWYPGISSFKPYPTLFIDDERPSPRALGLLAYINHVDGFLYYSATHFHEVENPSSQVGTWHNPDGAIGNGDGTLVYPGRPVGHNGPLPSIRLLQLRDGIDDFELYRLAEIALGSMSPIGSPGTLKASLTNFPDAAAYEAVHRRLVDPISGEIG